MDAAERDLIIEWADAGVLPNIRALRQRSLWGDVPVLPGLGSGALWPSFSMGVNPSRHGRYFSLHTQPGTYELQRYQFDWDDRRPFWQTLSQAGRKVAVIDIPYEALCKDINLHISAWGVHDKIFSTQIWPPEEAKEIIERWGADDPVGACDHYRLSEKEMAAFKERLLKRIDIKGELACRYLGQGGWDLFLTTFDETHPDRPTGQVCAAQVEVRPHNAKWSRGRVSHRPISPIKSGPRPIVTACARIRVRMAIVLSSSATGRSHLGNPG